VSGLQKGVLAIAAVVAMACASTGVALAGDPIAGVWTFGSGKVAIKPEGNGKYEGVVVAPVSFSSCNHPVGQKLWSGISTDGSGSYVGFHQWYFEHSSCTENPQLGPTAWRTYVDPVRGKQLEVCLSEPGGTQPRILANGKVTGAGWGCISSEWVADLPSQTGGAAAEHLTLPKTKVCLSGRRFRIHLQDPRYDPIRRVTITLRGKRIRTARLGNVIVATIDLRGLHKGAFTIKVHVVTTLGHHLDSTRTYHTCRRRIVSKHPAKKKAASGHAAGIGTPAPARAASSG
jgi:hypothetical protein